jgi:ribonuclease E
MAHVMPEHEHRVKRYRDDAPLFSRFQIEHQIESAYARTVQLPSGGAIVIDHTEALVSVDVNSARAIKGGDIEETATRTNLEAADEVARQMRLRDLGGLIVIDFIDMEESRNRRDVENRLRDALRQDRARVQFGTISKFGLMEMSRQRLRPALSEGASIPCPRCGGSGHIRDTESSALQILRIIQEESMKDSTASVLCQVPVDVASFLLNEKRSEIAKIEMKQRINVLLVPNKTLETPNYKLERLKHDDPRLDNIEASYKLAEEIEDPTLVTRRSQEKHNKQEPVIKGVLPDVPAPIAAPKPEPVAPAANRQRTPAARTPAAAPAAEKGFFGWIKGLFSSETAPASPVQEPRKDERSEGRRDERGERSERGGRDGRRGGRGERGARSERGGERGPDRGEAREPREPREPRRERSTEARPERAPGEGRTEGGRQEQPRGEGQGRSERPRRERGDRSAERNGAPRDAAQEELALANQAAMAAASRNDPTNPDAAREERQPREARGEGRRERGGRRNDRRDGAPGAEDNNAAFADGRAPQTAERVEGQSGQTEPGNGQTAGEDGSQERAPRERRSRDRYGRDRRERVDRTDANADSAPAAAEGNNEQRIPVTAELNFSEPVTTQASAPALAPVQAAVPAPAPAPVPAHAPAAPARTLPQVASYDLPLQDLAQVASASGLQWVNSDATKIAQIQAAMAAEPRPVHVPRERPPAVVLETSPLVLVETQRDLRNMSLPFEEGTPRQDK